MAVTKLNGWQSIATVSGNTLTLTTVSAGTNRLIVVFVTTEATDPVATAVSIGGQSGEQISGSPVAAGTGTTQQTVSAWIIKEAAIAAKSNNVITITFTTAPASVSIHAAVFAGVDQTTPVIEYNEDFSAAATPNPLTACDLTVNSTDNWVISCAGCGNATTAAWGAALTEQTEEASINATAGGSVAEADPSSTGAIQCRCTWASQNRAAQISIELQPPQTTYEISGITKDGDGSALGSCECYLVKIDATAHTAVFVDYVLSNASTGAYSFTGIGDNDGEYMVIAWKDDAPHVMDATDYVLTPIEE